MKVAEPDRRAGPLPTGSLERSRCRVRSVGTILLRSVVAAAQDRYGSHGLFPNGRLTNYARYTKVDLEARCDAERIPGKSPQRIARWRPDA